MTPLVAVSDCLDDIGALRARADALGYLYLPSLLPASDLGPARAALRAICVAEELTVDAAENPPFLAARPQPRVAGMGYGEPRWMTVQRAVFAQPAVAALREHPLLLGLLSRLFDDKPRSGLGDLCRILLPGRPEDTTPPHQDHLQPDAVARTWTAWLPLVECPLEMGPLAVVAGSHHGGHRAHSTDASRSLAIPDDADWSASALVPGDVVLFNGFTIHKALVNRTSDRVRVSLDFRFRPARAW
jgi:hypothetical protein